MELAPLWSDAEQLRTIIVMFGFLKNLLRRSDEDPGEAQGYDAAEAQEYVQPAPSSQPRKNLVSARRPNGNGHGYSQVNAGGHRPAAGDHHKMVEVPLRTILPGLPLEVQPYMLTGDFFEATVPVPLERVLSQLSRGSVRISFGELRAAVPEAFADDASQDKVLITLPLGEVLARINPALIQRRRAQRTIEVPADISSPFDTQNQSLIFSVGPAKETPAPAAHVRQTAPAAHPVPGRKSIVSAPTPPPPGALPTSAIPARPMNLAPAPEPPAPVIPMQPAPAPAPAPIPMPIRMAPVMPPAAAAPAAPAPAPAPAEPEPETGEPLYVSLTSLAEAWPDAIRKEILDQRLVDTQVALPAQAIELALKQGRIAFSWKVIRSWIRPPVPSFVSVHDPLVLELPLKVVAPVFLVRQKEAAKEHSRVAIDAEIPNLFFGSPQNELQDALSVTKPADTNFYVWDDNGDTARVDISEIKRGPSPGTKFVAKYATPNEIVSRAAALEGVAGAIIALPDGLMVANSVPSDLNPDTVAAFLPQIFGKVSSCTKELRMGELNNLNFTVGNVPWKIFRVNAIFFAAFGREGQALPTARLAALAAELDHKPR
jgi:predicted regulator of Ras-like GTPase activity (Roadblock/LC7/MglB family)